MALVDVRPYMRSIMDGLDYSEWKDGFNSENIPSTIIDGSYHLATGTITGSTANQQIRTFDYTLVTRVFFKGFRDPAGAIDDALGAADTILASALADASRLSQANIKDIIPNTIQVLPLEASNDNSVILEMDFSFNIYECY